jgi:metal-responsive CopG/Arc/MetJ family transcriptional regulator
MRTTVTIPDAIFAQVEHLAAQHGMSRSELYTQALAQLLESAPPALGVRERLDSVYAADPRSSELEPGVATLQEQSLERKW